MKYESIPLHELPEAEHPATQSPPELEDGLLDRYHAAVRVEESKRTRDEWAIVTAVHEAAPDLASEKDLINYYAGDDSVPQARPPVQGGGVNQA